MSRERPILFNGEMVRAILEGRKTMTRRMIKDPQWEEDGEMQPGPGGMECVSHGYYLKNKCPYGQSGDRLWVRETWAIGGNMPLFEYAVACKERMEYVGLEKGIDLWFKATDCKPDKFKWRPSIHMPKYLSRITLEVTDVRVERVQEISEADARSEGMGPETYQGVGDLSRDRFEISWDSIYKNWDANPWVWVVKFRRIQ